MVRNTNSKDGSKTSKQTSKTPSTSCAHSATRPSSAKKANTPPNSSQKRKRDEIDLSQVDDQTTDRESSGKKQKKDAPEKRLKPFRAKAPQSFLLKLERATSQRMIVIGRTRSGEGEDLREDIDIVGTTGNIYTVTISRQISCTCPDSLKGNECKHKVYCLATVLRAPYELCYQRSFLTNEVEEILSGAPPIPNASCTGEEGNDGKRKPIEGECPICYMEYDPDNNEIVWCKSSCGNNIHKNCFEQWAASQRQTVRCVFCRAPWQIEKGDLETIKSKGEDSGDGYVNVAENFGISRVRDTSSYYQPWVRRNMGYG